jgi:tRNA nucleotidyltransferase (CCA-adding enzyme)
MKGFEQHNRYHPYDVWEHTAYVVQNSRPHPMNRWAALLHDSGKPDTFYRDERGVGHMPGHPAASVKHLRSIAARMRFSSRLTERLALLIIHHDDRPAATKADVRRLYARLDGDDDLFHRLCDLMRADSLSKAQFTRLEGVIATNAVEQLFDRMKEEREAFGIADIPVNGRDIMELGIAQGPQVGRILDQLLDEVLEGTLRCTRAVLLARAREIAEGGGGNDLS